MFLQKINFWVKPMGAAGAAIFLSYERVISGLKIFIKKPLAGEYVAGWQHIFSSQCRGWPLANSGLEHAANPNWNIQFYINHGLLGIGESTDPTCFNIDPRQASILIFGGALRE